MRRAARMPRSASHHPLLSLLHATHLVVADAADELDADVLLASGLEIARANAERAVGVHHERHADLHVPAVRLAKTFEVDLAQRLVLVAQARLALDDAHLH